MLDFHEASYGQFHWRPSVKIHNSAELWVISDKFVMVQICREIDE